MATKVHRSTGNVLLDKMGAEVRESTHAGFVA